jgi:hypothetical protein
MLPARQNNLNIDHNSENNAPTIIIIIIIIAYRFECIFAMHLCMLGPHARIKKMQASVGLRLMTRCFQPTTPFQALGPWTPF